MVSEPRFSKSNARSGRRVWGDQSGAESGGAPTSNGRDEPGQPGSSGATSPLPVASRVHDEAILSYEEIPRALAEPLRQIVHRYELRHSSGLPPTIGVTSAMRGEGVTTVSQALATLIAQESGQYVCWVDCSWLAADEQPPGAEGRPGLIDILTDSAKILSAFQSAPEIPQLFTLRAGPLPESKRNRIVRSPQFDSLLDVLTHEFDHVIFDIPPVLANAGGLALVRRSDASLFVVRQRVTSMNQFQRLVEATDPTPNLGVLLNQYRTSIPRRLRRLLGD